MVTGSTPISELPTGTIDNLQAVFPLTIGMPSSPDTIQASLTQLASQAMATQFAASGTVVPNNGWIGVSDAWTYNATDKVNVPSDATAKYQKGMKIRFKQGGSYKYFYGITIAATLLTVTGGSDYSVANSAITDIAYSFIERPFGFPEWLNYTPAITIVTVGNGTLQGRFKINGLTVKWYANFTLGNTSAMGSGAPAFSNPVTLSAAFDVYKGDGIILDAGTTRFPCSVQADQNNATCVLFDAGATYLTSALFSSTAPMTWITNDALTIQMEGILA